MTNKSKNKRLLLLLLALLMLCISLGFWNAKQYQSANQLSGALTETQSQLVRSDKEILNLMLTLDSQSEEYINLKNEYDALKQREKQLALENNSKKSSDTSEISNPSPASVGSLASEIIIDSSGTAEKGNSGELVEAADDAVNVIDKSESLPLPDKKPLIFNGIVLRKGEPINLDIQFANSSDRLTETKQLEDLANFLKNHSQVVIKLSGHTEPNPPSDSAVYQETADMHDRLSKRRVESVAVFLANKGVDQAQIETAYFGGRQSKYSKDPKKNRRVEMEIIKE